LVRDQVSNEVSNPEGLLYRNQVILQEKDAVERGSAPVSSQVASHS